MQSKGRSCWCSRINALQRLSSGWGNCRLSVCMTRKAQPVKLRLRAGGGHILILAFRNHSELHAQGVQDRIDGFEAWVRAGAKGFVEALSSQSRVFGDLRHASCL